MPFTREIIRKLAKESDVELPKEFIDGLMTEHVNARDGYADEQVKAALENQPKPEPVKITDSEEYKALKQKFDNEKSAHDKLKSDVAAKETLAAKEKAVSAYYESKNITGKNLPIAMRGSKAEIDGIEFDKNGKIKDTSALDALIGGVYAGLAETQKIVGANTPKPPTNTGGETKEKSRASQIYKEFYGNKHGVKES